ncbi:MAG: aldo/keto reductase [Pleurocapsa sp. SU_196_0]|nr:aldo/keto reductase [Pleurocapsa sp. SU_196_0]
MNYTRLGNTGMQVSRLCLGMMTYGDPSLREWSLPLEDADPFVKRALEAGINFFDTANAYSAGRSEEITGVLLKKYAARDDVVVATKVFFSVGGNKPNAQGLSRKHIFGAIDASLKRLDMEYVDLYQIHRFDPNTPLEETMSALHDVVKSGRARYIGASSMYAWQFAKAQRIARENGWTEFVSMQNHYNLVYREEEREMIPQCVDMGVGVIPWSPLARGLLAGNRTRDGQKLTKRAATDSFGDTLYTHPSDFDTVERLQDLATARGQSAATLALAWLLHKPGVTAPIIGASKMQHLEDALNAVDAKLSSEDIAQLEELYVPHAISGHA